MKRLILLLATMVTLGACQSDSAGQASELSRSIDEVAGYERSDFEQAAPPTAEASAQANSCSAPTGGGSCLACSVSCPATHIAYCQQGDGYWSPLGAPQCRRNATCTCQRPSEGAKR